MFFYLIYNSTIIKKDNSKNKNITTLIYGTIIYIIIHAFIYINNNIKEALLRYFWVIFSVDIISMFLSSEITGDIQKHTFIEDIETAKNLLKKKKRKPIEVIEVIDEEETPNLKERKILNNNNKSSRIEDLRKNIEEKQNRGMANGGMENGGMVNRKMANGGMENGGMVNRKMANGKMANSRMANSKMANSKMANGGMANMEETQNILDQIDKNVIEEDTQNILDQIDKNVIEEDTQNILDQIDKNVIVEDYNKNKHVNFNVPDDTKSEISDGSDLELDLESFEMSLLED
jgi:hypothetical protein